MENFEYLYYNAGILIIDDKVLLTKEDYQGNKLIKLPGGMQEKIDCSLDAWLKKFKELLSASGFSDKEVEFLSHQESLLKRSRQARSLIRKFLMETGVYPSVLKPVYLQEEDDIENKKTIIKKFFFSKGYFKSGEAKVLESEDVSKLVFFYPDEVLGNFPDNEIFKKHRTPLVQGLELGLESEQIKIDSLSEFNWE
jgi:hypothetical protein